jgi:glycosyltransferase involved in cell wall biosynthesis
MRIFLVTRGLPPGGRFGLEHYTQHLCSGLLARGHEVTALFPGKGLTGTWSGYRVVPLPGSQEPGFHETYTDPDQDRAFAAELQQHRPQVVHFLTLGGGVSMGMVAAAKSAGVRVVASLTDYVPICHRGFLVDDEDSLCSEGLDPARCASCCNRRDPHVLKWNRARAERREKWARWLDFLGERSPFFSRARFARRLEVVQGALAAVDRFVCSTDAVAARHVQWGIAADRIVKAPRAFDPALYAGFLRTPRKDVFRFGFVGQFALHKGLHILVDAMRGLYGRVRNFRVALYGAPAGGLHPEYGDVMRKRIKDLALPAEDRGSFAPDRLKEVFAEIDALVIPSIWSENLPTTLLHARATRTPVVATNVPGIAEFVKNNIDAFTVSPGNSTSLAERMEKVMIDPQIYSKFAEASAVPEEFGVHLAKLEAAYAG